MNLTGHWKGKYVYGKGYPKDMVGGSAPFEFKIQDIDGNITGICFDEIVQAVEGNESTIEGSFKGNFIQFVKKYKHHLAVGDEGNYIMEDSIQTEGVHYVGHFHKKFFSRKVYFVGEWQIVSEYTDESGKTYTDVVEGTWTMSKV